MLKNEKSNNNLSKDVGILTLYNNSYNYGGLLQAYALAKVINDLGYRASQIKYDNTLKRKLSFNELFNYYSLEDVSLKISKKLQNTNENKEDVSSLFVERIKKTSEFAGIIPHTNDVFSHKNLDNLLNEFDIFIVGSDQIWNRFNPTYFLSFVPQTHGKISYAASMSISGVAKKKLKYMSKYINRFDFVSVRESSAKENLDPFVERDIQVLLDPTFLLNKQEWCELLNIYDIKKRYIFVYLLGDNSNHRERIKEIAKKFDLAIVFIPHVHLYKRDVDIEFADYEIYDAGPKEFIGLIKDAEIIITDSFHGCVISSILEKNFWAVKRHADTNVTNMNSRLYTLFENMKIKDRFLENVNDDEIITQEIDYDLININIDALRQNSIKNLSKALNNCLDE